MKIWKIHKKISSTKASKRRQEIIASLLKKRGLDTPSKVKDFLHPQNPHKFTPKQLGINLQQLNKATTKIKEAIKTKRPIVVYGDYDADGICSSAVLWETLHKLGANASPFIPHRQKHGYGISQKGIDDILKNNSSKTLPLIITVDNGIVANTPVSYANQKGLEVIISDHHVATKKLPPALSIVHTTQLSGSGVAWFLAKSIWQSLRQSPYPAHYLELAALGSVADMVPLLDANRSIVSYGLNHLKKTKRLGLLKIFKQAGINKDDIDIYHINFVIAPRLNATGRLGHALDSLRLLCTTSVTRADKLAQALDSLNQDRQQLTQDQLLHAKDLVNKSTTKPNIIIVSHTYHEGVIGLIAGRLAEEFYRPAIVLSHGKKFSKASARSIKGFNIIEALRKTKDLLVDVGGHPMAAGFTIATKNIPKFTKKIQALAKKQLTAKALQKSLHIDCQIQLSDINWDLYDQLEQFAPFGIANPRPIFATSKATVASARAVGQENKHLKLTIKNNPDPISTIGFYLGSHSSGLNPGDQLDIAYTLDKNEWNNKKELQLKLKDLKIYLASTP